MALDEVRMMRLERLALVRAPAGRPPNQANQANQTRSLTLSTSLMSLEITKQTPLNSLLFTFASCAGERGGREQSDSR